MSTRNRRAARESALKVLFALKIDQQADPGGLLGEFWNNFRFADDILGEPVESVEFPLPEAARRFAEMLVKGVVEHRNDLDERIRDAAKNWSLERMAAVDLSILRLGAFELLYLPDVPVRVTINEAIEIAKRYGTKESPAFVNGLLDKIARLAEKSPESR